jgi:hypothetical protein
VVWPGRWPRGPSLHRKRGRSDRCVRAPGRSTSGRVVAGFSSWLVRVQRPRRVPLASAVPRAGWTSASPIGTEAASSPGLTNSPRRRIVPRRGFRSAWKLLPARPVPSLLVGRKADPRP